MFESVSACLLANFLILLNFLLLLHALDYTSDFSSTEALKADENKPDESVKIEEVENNLELETVRIHICRRFLYYEL